MAASTQRVVKLVVDAVGTSLRALEKDSCEQPESWGGPFGIRLDGPELSAEERRSEFKNWVLAKGFQDLTRGVREGLEEAYFYLGVVQKLTYSKTTLKEIEQLFSKLRHKAAAKNFPELLADVNDGLSKPVAFDTEFQSLQKVRNCLEHRGGVVGKRDVDLSTGLLTLSFPRMKFFYVRGGEEIEIEIGKAIDTHSNENPFGKEEVTIMMRRVARSKMYRLGENVLIEPIDFFEIALACHLFASDVATKLPRPSSVTDASSG